MRLSANHGSPYWTEAALDARVTIDGVECFDVMEACEEEGWADVLVRDTAALLVVDGDSVKIERRHGVVQILTEHR